MPNKNLADHISPAVDRVFAADQPVPPTEWLAFNFEDAGGSDDMAVDGSVTPVPFGITAPPGRLLILARLVIQVVDTPIRLLNWFGEGAPIVNGLGVQLLDEETVPPKLTVFPGRFRRTLDFSLFSLEPLEVIGHPAPPDIMSIRWNLNAGGYAPIINEKQTFSFVVNDDLTGMNEFQMLAVGRIVVA
jgi:hypothetical protein